VTVVVAALLRSPWPREVVALSEPGVPLVSRELASREMIGLVDCHLLMVGVPVTLAMLAVASLWLWLLTRIAPPP
jgi:hypothetical protein